MSDNSLISYLRRTGWAEAAMTPLDGEPHQRSYFRLEVADGQTRLLMDSQADPGSLRRFRRVGRLLRALGVRVPEIHFADMGRGKAVIEDLGTGRMGWLIDNDYAGYPPVPDPAGLYDLAVDLLIHIQREFPKAPPEAAAELPHYSPSVLARQVGRVCDSLIPALTGQTPPEARRNQFVALWERLLSRGATGSETLILRDFHVDNLMFLPAGQGLGRCGVLDFQDAGIGPPAYDLVCLLEDARRPVPEAIQTEALARYLDARPELDPQAIRAHYPVLAAQQHLRRLAALSRRVTTGASPQSRALMPQIWARARAALAEPALEPARQWLELWLGAENFGRLPDVA